MMQVIKVVLVARNNVVHVCVRVCIHMYGTCAQVLVHETYIMNSHINTGTHIPSTCNVHVHIHTYMTCMYMYSNIRS